MKEIRKISVTILIIAIMLLKPLIVMADSNSMERESNYAPVMIIKLLDEKEVEKQGTSFNIGDTIIYEISWSGYNWEKITEAGFHFKYSNKLRYNEVKVEYIENGNKKMESLTNKDVFWEENNSKYIVKPYGEENKNIGKFRVYMEAIEDGEAEFEVETYSIKGKYTDGTDIDIGGVQFVTDTSNKKKVTIKKVYDANSDGIQNYIDEILLAEYQAGNIAKFPVKTFNDNIPMKAEIVNDKAIIKGLNNDGMSAGFFYKNCFCNESVEIISITDKNEENIITEEWKNTGSSYNKYYLIGTGYTVTIRYKDKNGEVLENENNEQIYSCVLYGDCDGDGEISPKDALMIVKYCNGQETTISNGNVYEEAAKRLVADEGGDKVNILDALAIIKHEIEEIIIDKNGQGWNTNLDEWLYRDNGHQS